MTMMRTETAQETGTAQDGERCEDVNGLAEPMTLTPVEGLASEGSARRVVLHQEWQLVFTDWLLTATDDPDRARYQWAEGGVALLSTGEVFSALRVPADLVWAQAGTDDLTKVDAFLRQTPGGPVFMDLHTHLYYFLLPGDFSWGFSHRDFPGVECRGRGDLLGVPDVRLTVPRGRSYWCAPAESPGELCVGQDVESFVRAAQKVRRTEDINR
ncbi:hypothetical protein [Streptomyces torulosus]|uniref:hypothetical protein n=1 Tax=Streptomyces torulosus TaxID=68276 RepID=UPI001471C81B|nr:hypothetical protein [Streptomyces torulosus]